MTDPTANSPFGLADRVDFFDGPGGLPFVTLRSAAATAVISLYGGQVLSYRPTEAADDLLFLSDRAHYRAGKAIKGGIPVCWPWFGADPDNRGRPAHGFARTATWAVHAANAVTDDHTRLVLRLRDDDTTRALWPHGFELLLAVDVGETLDLALQTHNTGSEAFTVTQALHTYLAIAAHAHTEVIGLDATDYLDKTLGFAEARQSGPVTFSGEVDRIYQDVRYPLRVLDRSGGREIAIEADHSRTAVVWNPGAAISAAMDDLDDDAFERFVCVETANAADDTVTLAPGETFTLTSRYRIAG